MQLCHNLNPLSGSKRTKNADFYSICLMGIIFIRNNSLTPKRSKAIKLFPNYLIVCKIWISEFQITLKCLQIKIVLHSAKILLHALHKSCLHLVFNSILVRKQTNISDENVRHLKNRIESCIFNSLRTSKGFKIQHFDCTQNICQDFPCTSVSISLS